MEGLWTEENKLCRFCNKTILIPLANYSSAYALQSANSFLAQVGNI